LLTTFGGRLFFFPECPRLFLPRDEFILVLCGVAVAVKMHGYRGSKREENAHDLFKKKRLCGFGCLLLGWVGLLGCWGIAIVGWICFSPAFLSFCLVSYNPLY